MLQWYLHVIQFCLELVIEKKLSVVVTNSFIFFKNKLDLRFALVWGCIEIYYEIIQPFKSDYYAKINLNNAKLCLIALILVGSFV